MKKEFIFDFIAEATSKKFTDSLHKVYARLPLSQEAQEQIDELEKVKSNIADPYERINVYNQIATIQDQGPKVYQEIIGNDVITHTFTFEELFEGSYCKHFSVVNRNFIEAFKTTLAGIKIANISKKKRTDKLQALNYSLSAAICQTLDWPGLVGLKILDSLEDQINKVIYELETIGIIATPRYDIQKIRSFLEEPNDINPDRNPNEFTGVISRRKEETYYLSGQRADPQDAGFLKFKEEHKSFCAFTVKEKKIFTEEMLYQVYKNILAFTDNRHDDIVPLNIVNITITYLGSAVYELSGGKFFKSNRKKIEEFYLSSFKIKGNKIKSTSSLRNKADQKK